MTNSNTSNKVVTQNKRKTKKNVVRTKRNIDPPVYARMQFDTSAADAYIKQDKERKSRGQN